MHATRFSAAVQLALEAHAGQVRKGTETPYISHPLAVASLVMEDGGSDDEAIAAVLHDAVEDGGAEYMDRILNAFGDHVAGMVVECSDSVVPAAEEKPPWQQRKDGYLATIPGKSAAAIRVTTADKLHNSRAILADLREEGPAVFERFTAGRDGTLWYYGAVAEALASHPDARPRLADELLRTVDVIHELSSRD